MAKPEWGTKRICQSCGARFYDLQRQPIVCPSCGTVFDLEAAGRPKRSRVGKPAPVEEELVKPKKVVLDEDAEFEEEDAGDGDEEQSASPIEDASELGEDDDVAEVIESGIEEDEEPR